MAMLKLPLELLEKVAAFAPVDGIASLSSTCRQMRALPPSLWAAVHQTHYPHIDAMEFGGPLQSLQLQRAVQVHTRIDAVHVEIPLQERSLSGLQFALRVQGDVEGKLVDFTTMGLQLVKYEGFRSRLADFDRWNLVSATSQMLPYSTALYWPPDHIDITRLLTTSMTTSTSRLDGMHLVASLVVLRKGDGATALVTTFKPVSLMLGENGKIDFSENVARPVMLPTRWSDTQGWYSAGQHDYHSLTIQFSRDPCPIEVHYHLNTTIRQPNGGVSRTSYNDESLGRIFHALLDLQKSLPLTVKVVIPRA
jgi:hypothetical protein